MFYTFVRLALKIQVNIKWPRMTFELFQNELYIIKMKGNSFVLLSFVHFKYLKKNELTNSIYVIMN